MITKVKLIEHPPYYAVLEFHHEKKKTRGKGHGERYVNVYNVTRRINRALKAVELWENRLTQKRDCSV